MPNRKYKKVKAPGHPLAYPSGYILEHRLVAANAYGVEVVRGKHVHHKDGDTLNNNLDNLVPCMPEEHSQFHRTKPGPRDRLTFLVSNAECKAINRAAYKDLRTRSGWIRLILREKLKELGLWNEEKD